jgi:hypothetical protein
VLPRFSKEEILHRRRVDDHQSLVMISRFKGPGLLGPLCCLNIIITEAVLAIRSGAGGILPFRFRWQPIDVSIISE